ncbi:hypothetical protein O3X23_41985, partial [Streptomyces sp. H39-S7]|nr:hypothetical protein [Streptomyces sp. H39-S7]
MHDAAVPDTAMVPWGTWERLSERGGAAAAVSRQDNRRKIMKFSAQVEPPEPMRGLEVPPEVVA